jgi:DNA-binding transcriptional LysR family regulator
MDSTYLRTFLEIVRRGSFSEAAGHLKLSQPAVTFQIQRLERDLGVRLLDRGGGRLRLTPEGEAFHRHAERIVREEEALQESLSALAHEVRGELSMAASTVPGEFLVPALLAEFVRHYPHVQASVTVFDTEAAIEHVLRGEFDLGFTGARTDRPGLEQVPFVRDRMVLIVPPEHPFARRTSIRLEELHDQPLVTRESGSGTMATVRKLLQGAGLDMRDWSNATVLSSTQAVISGVQAGLGVAFVSAFAAAVPVRARAVHALNVEGVKLERDFFVVYQEGRLSTRLQHEFVAFAHTWGQTHQPPSLGG